MCNHRSNSYHPCCCELYQEDPSKNNKWEINVENTIKIEQSSEANGGEGGDSGDVGETVGGSAAATSAIDSFAAALSKTQANDIEKEDGLYPQSLEKATRDELAQKGYPPEEEEETSTAKAYGGYAVGGISGTGGDGGDGGTSSNEAWASIDSVVVIINDNDKHHSHHVNLGVNGKNYNITFDKNGRAFLNGQQMAGENFQDGSGVLIFRNNQVTKQ